MVPTDEQKVAIYSSDPRLLVSACPGSGKTTVLTERLAHMIRDGWYKRLPDGSPAYLDRGYANPSSVLAMTFTRKAAAEMQARLVAKVGERATKVRVCTIHSACLEIIRQLHICPLTLATDDQRALALEIAAEKAGILPREASSRITLHKAHGSMDNLVEHYDQELKRIGLCDFDDLLLMARHLLETTPSWQSRLPWVHILVDEAQDLNPVQRDIITILAGRPGATLFVVGDSDQAIYGFRGADPHLFLAFEGVGKLRLSRNWRSGACLVSRAARLASESFLPLKVDPGRLEWFSAQDPQDELNQLVAKVKEEPVPKDVAILVRTNSMAINVAVALRQGGVQVLDEDRLLELSKYRNLAALLEMVNDPEAINPKTFFKACQVADRFLGRSFAEALVALARANNVTLWRAMDLELPKRWMSHGVKRVKQLVATLDSIFKRTKDVQVLIREAAILSGWLERFIMDTDDLVPLIRLAAGKQSIRAFLHAFNSFATSTEDGVRVLTAHRSKGLEFPRVYLPFVNLGIYPHHRSNDHKEERRLLYVAITRAKERLTISWTSNRPSPFLADLGLPPVKSKRVLWLFTKKEVISQGFEGEELLPAAA